MEIASPRSARIRWCLLAIGAVAVGAIVVGFAAIEAQERRAQTTPPTTILFLCPRGAAKSVLASAYFARAARARGLNVRVESAGTEPDPRIAPAVAAHLAANGYTVPTGRPRRVTDADLATADVLVSIGCDLRGLRPPNGMLVTWNEVPALSEDFARADESIRKRVSQLVEELARQRR